MLEALMNTGWGAFLAAFGTGVVRSFAGWIENAVDAKSDLGTAISKFEFAQLVSTVVRVGILTMAAFLPFEAFGVDGAALAAAGSAFLLDWLVRKMSKTPVVVTNVTAKKK